MGIAHELITRGWHQGDFRADDGSVCLYGACIAAQQGDAFDLLDREDLTDAYGGDYEKAIVRVVIVEHGHSTVAQWNDDPTTTFDEVLRAAKEADALVDAL